ncbi:MAG: precorrin-6y C5,15-methyltransferase (decarboxylating) subunit CbiE [Nitrospinae bacterium]|nr:precorrin-6y C5,15-methyltransferase (decarboxylating) subunit CbiE [Nitrospinota bacterium]
MAGVKPITVVGCGPGSPDLLTEAALNAVAEAECLVGSKRLLALFPTDGKETIAEGADVQRALEAISARIGKKSVAVLVSGDPGIYSLSAHVIKKFGVEMCRVIPGISAVQCAFAKIGVEWGDYHLVSAHAGAPNADADFLAKRSKITVLAGTRQAMEWIAELAKKIGEGRKIFVCEKMSLEDEKVTETNADGLRDIEASSLTLVLLIKKECMQ